MYFSCFPFFCVTTLTFSYFSAEKTSPNSEGFNATNCFVVNVTHSHSGDLKQIKMKRTFQGRG